MERQAKQRHERRESRRVDRDLGAAPATARIAVPPRSTRWRWPAIAAAVTVTGGIAWGLAGRWRPGEPAEPAPAAGTEIASLRETEPNDTLAAAQPLTWPDSDVAATAAPDDRDVYVLSVAADGPLLLDAWIEGGDGLAIEATGQNRSRRQLVVTPAQIRSLGIVRAGGPFFITVGGADGATSRPYRLRVRARPPAPGEEAEPNDDPATLARRPCRA